LTQTKKLNQNTVNDPQSGEKTQKKKAGHGKKKTRDGTRFRLGLNRKTKNKQIWGAGEQNRGNGGGGGGKSKSGQNNEQRQKNSIHGRETEQTNKKGGNLISTKLGGVKNGQNKKKKHGNSGKKGKKGRIWDKRGGGFNPTANKGQNREKTQGGSAGETWGRKKKTPARTRPAKDTTAKVFC